MVSIRKNKTDKKDHANYHLTYILKNLANRFKIKINSKYIVSTIFI